MHRSHHGLVSLIVGFILGVGSLHTAPLVQSSVHDVQQPTGANGSTQAVTPSKPASQMERLAFLAGTWIATDTYERTQFIPNGGSGSGEYKTVFGPGASSLLTDYRYRGPQGESSGHQVITWDLERKAYVGCAVTSTSTGLVFISGHWEGQNLVLSGEFKAHGLKVNFKSVYSKIANRSMTVRQYNSIDGGPSQLFGTSTVRKQ
jgi:hypothetical protein